MSTENNDQPIFITGEQDSIKHWAKRGLRKVLKQVDKGLEWGQKHPVAVERTLLVIGTFYVTRAAYKRFAPSSSVNKYVFQSIENAQKNIDAAEKVLDQLDASSQAHIIRSFTPDPYDAEYVNELFHLEVSDADILDMNEGMGMVFNVKGFMGKPNHPLCVVPYVGLMKTVLKGDPDFPRNYAVEELLEENKEAGWSGVNDLLGSYFGTEKL